MKILFVTHDFDSGGAARSLWVLVQRLHAMGHALEIVSLMEPKEGHAPLQTYRSLGIPITIVKFPWISMGYVGVGAPSAKQPQHVRQLHAETIKQVQTFEADVACFNGFPTTSLAPYLKAKRKVLIAREVLDPGRTPLFSQNLKSLKRHIDHAVAIGPVEGRQLDEAGIPCTIIFNTANVAPQFMSMPTPPPVRFGCFANMYEGKGQGVLAVACAAVKDNLRAAQASIHIYGTGHQGYMDDLRAFIHQQGIEDVVLLRGWVDNVEAVMRDMHCIVRPDLTGSPWGRDVIEAMSMGRPLLATGSEDVFVKQGATGWLIPPDDPTALARSLVTLSHSPALLVQAGQGAFDFAREHFDPEGNARKVEAVLTGQSS